MASFSNFFPEDVPAADAGGRHNEGDIVVFNDNFYGATATVTLSNPVVATDFDTGWVLLSGGDAAVANAVDDLNSVENITFWTGTRAEYDAITTPDANTIYNITDDVTEGGGGASIANNTTANHIPFWDGDSLEDSPIDVTLATTTTISIDAGSDTSGAVITFTINSGNAADVMAGDTGAYVATGSQIPAGTYTFTVDSVDGANMMISVDAGFGGGVTTWAAQDIILTRGLDTASVDGNLNVTGTVDGIVNSTRVTTVDLNVTNSFNQTDSICDGLVPYWNDTAGIFEDSSIRTVDAVGVPDGGFSRTLFSAPATIQTGTFRIYPPAGGVGEQNTAWPTATADIEFPSADASMIDNTTGNFVLIHFDDQNYAVVELTALTDATATTERRALWASANTFTVGSIPAAGTAATIVNLGTTGGGLRISPGGVGIGGTITGSTTTDSPTIHVEAGTGGTAGNFQFRVVGSGEGGAAGYITFELE